MDKKKSPNKKPIWEKIKKYPANKILIWLFIFTVGITITGAGYYLQEENLASAWICDFLQGLGASVLTAGMVSLISDLYLIDSLTKKTEKTYEKIIDKKMPIRYKNLMQSGIVDTYLGLKSDKLRTRISKAQDCDIFILKMWLSSIDLIYNDLYEAVENRNCTVRILLLDPSSNDAIEKRALSLR